MAYMSYSVMIEFESHGSHPAADFVNTLDERLSSQPEERLSHYEALVAFTLQRHLIDAPVAAALLRQVDQPDGQTVFKAALQLRESLFAVLWVVIHHQPPSSDHVFYIETEIQRTHAARHLVLNDWGFQWVWNDAESPYRPLWELALATENLLTSQSTQRIKKCAASDCGVIFVDDSRAGSRRWCSMAACGNRHKVKRFRSARK
jgi:predicted RNA-binding Zn ribbon-like protein